MCAYLATRNIATKRQEKDEKRKENDRCRNQYARVRCYKITSTLGLLVRGDPQNEGLRGLQPRALGSKLDYFHAGITSTVTPAQPPDPVLDLDGHERYLVEEILSERKFRGRQQFLVKWIGYDVPTWEPEVNVLD